MLYCFWPLMDILNWLDYPSFPWFVYLFIVECHSHTPDIQSPLHSEIQIPKGIFVKAPALLTGERGLLEDRAVRLVWRHHRGLTLKMLCLHVLSLHVWVKEGVSGRVTVQRVWGGGVWEGAGLFGEAVTAWVQAQVRQLGWRVGLLA